MGTTGSTNTTIHIKVLIHYKSISSSVNIKITTDMHIADKYSNIYENIPTMDATV